MLVWARAQRSRQWRSWLVLCCAALLAIAPLARPSLPEALAGSSVNSLTSLDQNLDTPVAPTSGVRPAQSPALGVVTRASLLENALGLPPVKSPRLGLGTDLDLLIASSAAGKPQGVTRQILHRSSIGTARAPTGPPL